MKGISVVCPIKATVVDLGPIQMTAQKNKMLPLPPIAGAVTLVGGMVLLVMGSRKD